LAGDTHKVETKLPAAIFFQVFGFGGNKIGQRPIFFQFFGFSGNKNAKGVFLSGI